MPCEGGGRSPVKCRRGAACRWLDGPFRNYARRPSRAALSRRLAVLRFGVGSVRTHCGPGAVVHEYSHAIRNLPERPALLSISTSAAGVVNRWGRAITFSVWTRKPASKPDGANSAPCLPPPAGRSVSNTNMRGPVRWRIGPHYSDVASARPASPRTSRVCHCRQWFFLPQPNRGLFFNRSTQVADARGAPRPGSPRAGVDGLPAPRSSCASCRTSTPWRCMNGMNLPKMRHRIYESGHLIIGPTPARGVASAPPVRRRSPARRPKR